MFAFACLLTIPLAGIASAAPGDPGLGRARFSWDPVSDPIVSGYKVYWGTTSGTYTHTEDAGNAIKLIVTGFSEGGAYFAAVTAYSATGEESSYSTEISFVYDTSGTTITFTSQPQAQAVTVGQTATFSVAATGSGTLTYQWQKGGTAINGATAATYSIVSPVVTDTGSYAVRVVNADGSAASDAATLTVIQAVPVIAQAPMAASITLGVPLAGATLSGGTASVAGSFAFASPSFVPSAGITNHPVIFTPSDQENYSTASVEVAVTVAGNFASWFSSYGELAGQNAPTDDPDGDGFVNLVEYALASGDPGSNNSNIQPIVSIVTEGNQSYLALTVQKNPTATDIHCLVEVSGELMNWSAGAGHTVLLSETANTLVVRDNFPMGSSASRFIRLKVAFRQL